MVLAYVAFLAVNVLLTCALEPPIPNELMLIRFARSLGHVVGFTGTMRLFSVNGTFKELAVVEYSAHMRHIAYFWG